MWIPIPLAQQIRSLRPTSQVRSPAQLIRTLEQELLQRGRHVEALDVTVGDGRVPQVQHLQPLEAVPGGDAGVGNAVHDGVAALQVEHAQGGHFGEQHQVVRLEPVTLLQTELLQVDHVRVDAVEEHLLDLRLRHLAPVQVETAQGGGKVLDVDFVKVHEALEHGEVLQVGTAVRQHGQHVGRDCGIVPAVERVVAGQAADAEGTGLGVEEVHAFEQLQGGELLRLEVEVDPEFLLPDEVPEAGAGAKGEGKRGERGSLVCKTKQASFTGCSPLAYLDK